MTRSTNAPPRSSALKRYLTHGLFPQLRVFEACARLGNFSRAAEELCLAQPTVSCQIRKLNETVGTPLFDMSGRKVTLTPAGRELLTLCSEVFDRFSHFDRCIAQLSRQTPTVLRIATTTNNQYLVARALGRLAKAGDAGPVDLQIMNRRQLLNGLKEQQYDVYFAENASVPPGFDNAEVPGYELAILARRDHRLARRKHVSLEVLAPDCWILPEEGSCTRDALNAHFTAAGFVPPRQISLGSNDAVRSAILDGSGIGALPSSMFRTGPETEGLIRLNVEGFPLNNRCYAMLPSDRATTAVANQITALLAALRAKIPAAPRGTLT